MKQRSHKLGIDANQPVDYRGRVASRLKDAQLIAGTGAAWVRLNFVLGPAPGPENREWRQTFQTLVDQYRAEGMNIYGLIGHESVRTPVGDIFRKPPGSSATHNQAERWLDEYVENFATIVEDFYPKIRVFESFNEPDDWHGSNNNWLHPNWFAIMLTKIYEHIKSDARFRQITLISGPLQGLQENRNAAVDYLRQTYRYGKNRLGWGTANRPYPFDGVGYHLYVLESYNANWQQHERNMRRVYKEYTAAFRRVIRNAEGRDKPIYLSETGWPSAENNDRSKTFQAKHLSLILELMNDDPAVAIGIWFCTEDFLPKEKFYGLYELNNPTPQGRKPAYYAYKEFCEALAEESGGPNGGVIPPPPGPLKPLPTPINPELEAWLTELRTRMLGLERQMIILQAQMTELVAKYETVDDLAAEIERLKDQVARLAEGGVGGPPKPPIEDLTATLPRHPTKQFGSRPIEQIQWLIIQHTGNNPAIGAQRIAEYLVGKGRPGLTYHYFINDQALIQQINPLTAETSHPQVVMVGFAGDFTDKIPTLAQIEAGADLLAWLLSGLGLPLEAVKGAKEVSNTRSPGDQWDSGQRWGDKLRQEVEERL